MPKKGDNKYTKYLKDVDFNRWLNNVKRGSAITGDVNLRRMGKFVELTGKEPKELIAMKPREITDFLDDFITDMENRGATPNYISSILKAVKSWLAHNHITLTRKLKIKDAGKPITLTRGENKERVPTQDELKAILNAGDARARVAIVLMAHCGVRPEVIGDYKGQDGLKVEDFPELKIRDNTVEFAKVPTLINVREEISKTGNPYITFLGQQGCNYIKAYIQERINAGEKIKPSSAIISASKSALRDEKQHITSINVSDSIRQPIRTAGFKWRPYVLRGYFATHMMEAEAKGKIIRDYRTFWMGHTGGIEATYTTNKVLPENMIDDMRNAYEKAMEFLETEHEPGIKEEDMKAFVNKHMLKIAGYSDEEIDAMDLGTMADDEVAKRVQEKFGRKDERLEPDQIEDRAKNDREEIDKRTNGSRQKVIPSYMLEFYINEGFEYAVNVGEDKCIVKLPPPIPYH
ncbi:MAG: site-specific integrase [Candidatus Thermoplasmatota archaeon]|nr:site-specific integrase [Candidatus Thermoplasmatota archaeon]MCL5955028.1 site-specific integrase [Candidatus Thermoplasmatota archaeon]